MLKIGATVMMRRAWLRRFQLDRESSLWSIVGVIRDIHFGSPTMITVEWNNGFTKCVNKNSIVEKDHLYHETKLT